MAGTTTNQCHVHTIVGEVQSVIATMRNNNRFSTLATRESPLLKEFKQLRSILRPSTDITKLDPMIYLKPFLNVIHSEETSGPITGAALTSVDRFLTYGFLKDSPEASKAMKKITDTVVHCRFEATSLEGDDVVLMKILRVLLSCLSCPAGGLLSDDSVFEMLSICFRMSRGRLSELLKKTAERTFTEIVHIIFLIRNVHSKVYFEDSSSTEDTNEIASAEGSLIPPPSPVVDRSGKGGVEVHTIHTSTPMKDYVNPRGVRFQRLEPSSPPVMDEAIVESKESRSSVKSSAPVLGDYIPKPYGVGCVVKTFKFLVELTDPSDENVPESLKQMSLQLINTITETQPQLIERIPSLLELLCNNLCKFALQSLQTENLDRLNLVMRLFFNLYISLRAHLKSQFEVFFNNLLLFILRSHKFVTFEKQEIVLENLVQFFYQPTFAAELFANYDCHIHCTNLLEQYTGFLYKSACPMNGSLYSIQLLSFECLQALVETITTRCHAGDKQALATVGIQTEDLLSQRASKTFLQEVAGAFNKKATQGLAMMIEKGLLPTQPSKQEVARFLRNTPGLDKKEIGQYLCKQDKDFIRAYVETFDFTGLDYAHAVRLFLTSFLMSGEAQIIDRIVELFAHHWYRQNPTNVFASADVAYVLCYSIVMLNVDAHNVGVRTKMTEDEYIHRLRGINDGQDLPNTFLRELYRNITQHEIKIVEDQPQGDITEEKWMALLNRASLLGSYTPVPDNALDKEVFLLVCRNIIAALSVVFETSTDSETLENALHVFKGCASIASYYGLSSMFDNIIIHLCNFTKLLDGTTRRTTAGKKRIVQFGFNSKAHLAAVCMFNLVLQHGNYLREAWRNVVRCIISLHQMELLNDLIDNDSFDGKPKSNKPKPKDEAPSSGLLSFIPGWWGGSEPVEEEADPEEVEAESRAKQAVKKCPIRTILESSHELQSDSLNYLLKALILDSSPSTPKGNNAAFHEGNASFCLDLLTKVALMNQNRINFVWSLVADHFAKIIQMAKVPSEFVEKAIVCLLLLCVTLAPKDEVSSNVFTTLSLFLRLEPAVANAMSESTIIAISRLLQSHNECIRTPHAWGVTLGIVERCASSAQAHQRGFYALTGLLQMTGSAPEGPALQPDAFRPYLKAVLAYVSVIDTRRNTKPSSAPPEILSQAQLAKQPISIRAMNLLYGLFDGASTIPELKDDYKSREVHKTPLWEEYWSPVFHCWVRLSRDPRNEVRTHAMTLIQRALMSQHLEVLSPEGLRVCFEEVVFPLLETLLEPFASAQSEASRIAVEETRVRGVQLLSKSLLQYLHQLTQLSDFHNKLWPKILVTIEQYMQADQNGLLREAIPEALKNILLVMLQMNVFHVSNTINGHDIWTVSWVTIDSFCPSLKEDDSFRASLNTFQKTPVAASEGNTEAVDMIHRLAREASTRKGTDLSDLDNEYSPPAPLLSSGPSLPTGSRGSAPFLTENGGAPLHSHSNPSLSNI